MPTQIRIPTSSPTPTGDPIAARAAALVVVRRGSPDEIQEAAVNLLALGDLVPDTHFEPEEEEDDHDPADTLEPEVSEEDDPFQEGWDSEPTTASDGQRVDGEIGEDEFDGLDSSGFRLLVDENAGSCELESPDWIKWRGNSRHGHDWMENLERRLQVLRFVAQWLTEQRVAFLKDPQPWHLGCEALQEITDNWCPASRSQFIDHLNLLELGEKSIVLTAMDRSQLVWPDGSTQPLDFIFGPHVRMAWVASAVTALTQTTGRKIDEVLLEHKKTAIPKREKANFERKSLKDCDFKQAIQKSNAMADTAWAEVIKTFKNQMLS